MIKDISMFAVDLGFCDNMLKPTWAGFSQVSLCSVTLLSWFWLIKWFYFENTLVMQIKTNWFHVLVSKKQLFLAHTIPEPWFPVKYLYNDFPLIDFNLLREGNGLWELSVSRSLVFSPFFLPLGDWARDDRDAVRWLVVPSPHRDWLGMCFRALVLLLILCRTVYKCTLSWL